MAITVEDGTGLADADAFVSVSYCDTYLASRGKTLWTGDDTLKEQAIVRATAYLSEAFDWEGYRVKNRQATGGAQALAWPRHEVFDREKVYVSSNEIPVEVQKATAELALYELLNPGALDPTFQASTVIKNVKVGPVGIQFENQNTSASGIRPMILRVSDLVGQFLKTRARSSRLSGGSTLT